MEIIPAIDLKGGKCVRLYQGNYSKETIFSENPVSVALHWQKLGAKRLHIVDLDGASTGKPCHLSLVERIVHTVQIPVQIGGGIRKMETVAQFLEIGVERTIIGTAAVENLAFVKEVCLKFGKRIIVSIDAKNGLVSTHGWQEKSNTTAFELSKRIEDVGVKRLIYTDISRDGTLSEPNFSEIAKLVAHTSLPVIAAGGISSLSHLEKLSQLGVEGAIVGRAIYTGDLDLEEALLQFSML